MLHRVLSSATILLSLIKGSLEIDCYVCSSLAGNDKLCEDPFDPIQVHQVTVQADANHPPGVIPFPMSQGPSGHIHPNGSSIYLQKGCYGARKSRKTAFPATACLKLAGHFTLTGEKMVVRACALDGGSLTSDTEIVRQNHCGGFYLNDRYVRGCLEACFTDGCNTASALGKYLFTLTFFIPVLCFLLAHMTLLPTRAFDLVIVNM